MKLGVCVPYRNREEHLNQFVPAIEQYLTQQGIEYCIYFGHQVDDKLFNRGAMKNVAAKHAFEDGCDYIVWQYPKKVAIIRFQPNIRFILQQTYLKWTTN